MDEPVIRTQRLTKTYRRRRGLALLVISGPAQLDIPLGRLAAICLHLVLLGLRFSTLALSVGATLGRRSVVLAI